MKRIRILREPRGENMLTGKPDGVLSGGQIFLLEGRTLEVPNEIAELLTSPHCPECGAVFPGTKGTLCPRIHETDDTGEPIHDLEGESQQLVPGLAEEVEM